MSVAEVAAKMKADHGIDVSVYTVRREIDPRGRLKAERSPRGEFLILPADYEAWAPTYKPYAGCVGRPAGLHPTARYKPEPPRGAGRAAA